MEHFHLTSYAWLPHASPVADDRAVDDLPDRGTWIPSAGAPVAEATRSAGGNVRKAPPLKKKGGEFDFFRQTHATLLLKNKDVCSYRKRVIGVTQPNMASYT